LYDALSFAAYAKRNLAGRGKGEFHNIVSFFLRAKRGRRRVHICDPSKKQANEFER